MVGASIADGTHARGRVIVREYDTAQFDNEFPGWRAWTDQQQLALARQLDPVSVHKTTNTTCVGLHSWLADALHATTTLPPAPQSVALGRSNTTPSSSDTSLNDPVDRVDITQFANEDTQVRITAFVGENEANVDADAGETLSETGVYAGEGSDERLLNHSLLPTDYEKTSQKTMTVEIVLAFSAA